MTLSPFDFFLTFCLVVGLPLWALRSWRQLAARLERGVPGARLEAYRRVVVVQWSLVGLLALHVALRSIDPTALGFALPLDAHALGALLVSGALVMFVFGQARSALRDPETRDEARKQLEGLRAMLPHTPHENSWFRAVAWTAGICEEILYRGYLPWVLAFTMPTAWAFVVATLVFGVGHAYQGVSGIAKTTLIGGIMAALTYASGTLLPAIVLHVAVDAINGNLAYNLLRETAGPSTADDDEV